MTAELILFFSLAVVAITSALGMLFSRNAVYAALFLILNFVVVAVFYLMLSAPFIALAQVSVYAGAIMVLFLFVIMLLGAEQSGRKEDGARWMRPLAITLGVLLVAEILYYLVALGGSLPSLQVAAAAFGEPAQVGIQLFNQYLLPFEVISILLLVAMLGAIILSRSPGERR